jgi:hypothetical protein
MYVDEGHVRTDVIHSCLTPRPNICREAHFQRKVSPLGEGKKRRRYEVHRLKKELYAKLRQCDVAMEL